MATIDDAIESRRAWDRLAKPVALRQFSPILRSRAAQSGSRIADRRLESTFAGLDGSRYLRFGEMHAQLTALLERTAKAQGARLDPLIRPAASFTPRAVG